jgi:hypothetical protein
VQQKVNMSVWASRTVLNDPKMKNKKNRALKKYAIENNLTIIFDEGTGREYVETAAFNAASKCKVLIPGPKEYIPDVSWLIPEGYMSSHQQEDFYVGG